MGAASPRSKRSRSEGLARTENLRSRERRQCSDVAIVLVEWHEFVDRGVRAREAIELTYEVDEFARLEEDESTRDVVIGQSPERLVAQ